ncbi:MAG: phosphoglycerate dehydrogenase [Alphaproteobacteria bacterium]|nr:phosphoglycerate dehydrogenase [Alphaproteobacteria bacterium]
MPKVLISDELSPRAVEIFRARGIEVDVKTGLKPDQLRAIVGAYDGLAIRSATKVTREVLEVATNLKVVGRAGIGVDNVDIKTATQKGVVVMNTPYGNAITTAEHAIALMFALAREIPVADRSTRAGKWEKNRFMGVELSGKTLGIVGCGNIGSIVADRALGLKMKVVAFDPFLIEDRAKALGIDKVELDALLERADFISLHAPLTESTRNIIDAKALLKMKKGVRIINCARGGLIVEEDLKAAIESGHVAGAALDVFLAEPAKDNPLFALDQVIATPHLGASTTEAQEKVALQIAEQMSDFLLTGAVTNALNMPSVSAEEAPRLKPYMRLAELLGSMLGQVVEREVTAVTLELEGQAAELNPRPMMQAALAGLFRPMLDSANMVNAPEIARQRNIAVTETRHERDCDYQTLLRLTVVTEARSRSADGTLIGGTRPRLVAVQDIAIEADFGKHLLYVRNKDKPGFIGAIGTVLGSAGINIATFHLGRTAPGKDALCLIEVDQAIPEEVIEKVRNLKQVERVRTLSF